MALIHSFDRSDNTTTGSQNSNQSFFDWNSEMRAANQGFGRTSDTLTSSRFAEHAFLDFGDSLPQTSAASENNRVVEIRRGDGPQDKVILTNDGAGKISYIDTSNKQTTEWDGRKYESPEEESRQEQTIQMQQALQNFVRAIVQLCMIYSRLLQQNYCGGSDSNYGGGNSGGYGDTGSGGYDMPTAGPDSGYSNPDRVVPAAPRPARPRPQQPSVPRDIGSNSGSNNGSNNDSHNGSNAGADSKGGSNEGNSGSDRGNNSSDRGNSGDSKGNAGSDRGNSGNDTGKNDSPSGSRYENTPVVRGRTIFRDDFNGARGEMPNQKVFDTAHIGADGKTRQRGPSIDEDGIIDVKNTVQDGKGHLQLFAEREKTYDPVAKEYVNYTKGSMHTTDGLNFNLKDHPNGVVVEVRAKHPTADGAKFNALWLMTERWTADPSKGEVKGDTIEYDAAEGGGADIAIHYPVKDMATGKTKDNYGGGAHPTEVDFNDGKFHTYTVVITPNEKTGKGDVVQYVDGKKVFQKENVFPGDKDLHLKASMEVSPKWTKKTLTGPGGMDSDAAGVIDYIDVSELKRA